jgi:hypothetical protein
MDLRQERLVDLNSKTTIDLDNGDAPPVALPATFLQPSEAEQLRQYQAWLEKENLVAQLECVSCGSLCQAFVTTGDIGIFCDCRVVVSKVS